MLARQRLYGTKVGSVWAIYAADVEAFKRMRRPPGRPRKLQTSLEETESAAAAAGDMAGERASAGTHRLLRKRGRKRR